MRVESLRTSLVVAVGLLVAGCAGTGNYGAPGIGREALSLEEASREASLRGQSGRAISLQGEAVETYRSVDDLPAVAAALNRLGNLLQREGRLGEASSAYGEAALLSVGDVAALAVAENNLGTLAELEGDRAGARSRYESALVAARSGGAGTVEAAARSNLGRLALAEGDLSEAQSQLERALAIDRASGDRAGEAVRLRLLGAAREAGGDYTEAIAMYAEALALDRAREDARAIALDLVLSSEARVSRGDSLDVAVGERRRARDIHRLLGDEAARRLDERRLAQWCGVIGEGASMDCRLALDERPEVVFEAVAP